MVTVYLIRHCEAIGNQLRVFQGSTDYDISDIGAKQLEFLGERFKNKKIDKVYSSPLTRAYKTAKAVADAVGLEVIPDAGLTEINGGVIENIPLKTIFKEHYDLEYAWTYAPQNFAPQDGEPMRDVYERVQRAVKKIVSENDGKTIVIASHGAAIRTLLCYLLYGTVDRLIDVAWSDNTAVAKLVFDDPSHCKIVYTNDTSHLPPELLPKANRISSFLEDDKK